MKKLIPIFMAVFAFAFTSCEKDPDLDKLSDDYLVYTNYDKSFSFSDFTSYYLPDEILVLDGKDESTPNTGTNAQTIIAAIKSQMDSRGFELAADKASANLGMQVSYVQNTYYYTDYGYPNYGWSNAGYWPNYWGNYWGGGYYYPYAMSYSLTTNSYMIEIVNLEAPQGASAKLPVIWTCYLVGPTYSATTTTALVVKGISQAFAQSPYLKK